jgi:hypothetical protein
MKWKDIPGLEGFYQASKSGIIRSVTRFRRGKAGIPVKHCGKIRKPGKLPNGYLHLVMSKEGKFQRDYVHRLVWRAFKGPIPERMEINHKDGNKINNHLDNLEVCTHRQNYDHAMEHKLNKICYPGIGNPAARLTESDVVAIRSEYSQGGVSCNKLADKYGVCMQNVWLVVTRRTWKHI